MPSIRPHLPFASRRRRRADGSPQDGVPPDRPETRPVERPVISAAQAAYVGNAVIEIALLRAEFDGRLQG